MINDEYDPLAVALHEAVRALRRVELVAAMGGDDRIVRFVRPAIGVIERLASERGRGRQRERREGRLIMHTLDIPKARARIFHNGDWSGDVEVLLGVNPIGHPDQDAPPTARLCIPAAVFAAVAVKMVEEASQDVRSPSRGLAEAAIEAGEISADEIVEAFAAALKDGLGLEDDE